MIKRRLGKFGSCIIFKRWCRKKYAAFNCIGKKVIIGVLALSSILVAVPAKAKAQQDTSVVNKSLDIEEVTITADRTPVNLSRTTKVITIITSDDLARQPLASIDQALRGVASVDTRQRGGLGVQSDISIRGGNYEQTLILLNGIYFNDPQTGHFNLNLPVDFESVHRIEVIQGSATRVFGVNSMSGAVNVIIEPEKTNYIKFSAMGGDFNLYKLGVQANFFKNNFSHYISVNRFASSGYVKNTDFLQNNFYYLGNLDSKKLKLEYQTGYNQREFGANGFYSPKFPNQFEENNTALASFKLETKTKLVVSPRIYWRMNNDRFELFRAMKDAPLWYQKHNYHQTQMYGVALDSWFKTKFGKTSLGADYRVESIISTVLGDLLKDSIPIKGQNFAFIKGHKRDYTSIFIDHTYYSKLFSVSLGVMANYNSDLNQWRYFPGADVNFLILKNFSIFASANTSLRMPTFTDLYYKSATLIGNEHLKPEEAVTCELGGKYISKALQIQVSAFERQGKNLIDWIKYPGDSLWRSENFTDITYHGAEFSVAMVPSLLTPYLKFITKTTFSYAYLDVNKSLQGFESAYVLDNLKHKFAASITFNMTKKLLFSYKYTYQSRNGEYLKYENGVAKGLVPHQPFSLSDARLMWQDIKWNAFIELSNVFDKSYYDIGNIIQPGRWIRIGANYRINFR